ncbi:MAG: hypothetical protein M1838_003187, partial [Thelocarpon superellum]
MLSKTIFAALVLALTASATPLDVQARNDALGPATGNNGPSGGNNGNNGDHNNDGNGSDNGNCQPNLTQYCCNSIQNGIPLIGTLGVGCTAVGLLAGNTCAQNVACCNSAPV